MKSGYSPWVAALFGAACGSLSCSSSPAGVTMVPGDAGGAGDAAVCPLASYTASTSTTLSFATDIYPILSSATGCGIANACHGSPGVYVDRAGTRMQSFGGSPATVLAFLLGTLSVNAPGMVLVKPKNVGASFLANKISGKDALTCISSMCRPGASPGTITACGDPMPLPGYPLVDSDKTKILDWIAQGAAQ
jgi:hypothetical protein